jgi:hypothetical protein
MTNVELMYTEAMQEQQKANEDLKKQAEKIENSHK